jgi:hypothetical protein
MPAREPLPIGSFGIVVWVQAITAVSLRASKQDAAIFNENFT